MYFPATKLARGFQLLGRALSPILSSISQRRCLSTGKLLCANYEGDGKTTVSILNSVSKNILMINSISTHGFRLNNGIFAVGPIAVFPRTLLQWNVGSVSDINAETLSLFCLLEPKLDILIIGTGDKKLELSREAIAVLRARNISIEVQTTENACSTFNFLNAESRCVAAALIPPKIITLIPEFKLIGYNEGLDAFVESATPTKIRS